MKFILCYARVRLNHHLQTHAVQLSMQLEHNWRLILSENPRKPHFARRNGDALSMFSTPCYILSDDV